jgi:hypothetical protein
MKTLLKIWPMHTNFGSKFLKWSKKQAMFFIVIMGYKI